jgi:hypothetical protein
MPHNLGLIHPRYRGAWVEVDAEQTLLWTYVPALLVKVEQWFPLFPGEDSGGRV